MIIFPEEQRRHTEERLRDALRKAPRRGEPIILTHPVDIRPMRASLRPLLAWAAALVLVGAAIGTCGTLALSSSATPHGYAPPLQAEPAVFVAGEVRATAADLRDDLAALHPQAPASDSVEVIPAASNVREAPLARTTVLGTERGPDIAAIITAAAAEFGVDPDLLLNVAACESSLRPDAVGRAQEIGLYQWQPRTWEWLAPALGYSIADIAEPRAQARLTAWAIASGHGELWTCWRRLQEGDG